MPARRRPLRLASALLPAALLAFALRPAAPAFAADSPLVQMQRAAEADPRNPTLRYYLSVYRERAGDLEGCIAELGRTLEIGDGFLPLADIFPALSKDARWDSVRARFEARLPRVTDGVVTVRIPDRELLPEGIAYDETRAAWYVGSVPRRAIYRLGRRGALEPLSRPADSLDHVLGLAVDARARRLYAVSTNALTDSGRAARRNTLVVYDLDTRHLVHRVALPDARQLNDVAVLPGGDALLSDSEGGGVWRASPVTGVVTARVPLGMARGANGLAVAPGGAVAYVAGSRAVSRLDLASGALEPLAMPARESAAAIDGLYWWRGSLLGIQNVTTPARVVRLRLSADGRAVESVETLQSHHQPAFDEPTTGAIAPGGFHVLAATGVSRYDAQGTITNRERLREPAVLRIPLRP